MLLLLLRIASCWAQRSRKMRRRSFPAGIPARPITSREPAWPAPAPRRQQASLGAPNNYHCPGIVPSCVTLRGIGGGRAWTTDFAPNGRGPNLERTEAPGGWGAPERTATGTESVTRAGSQVQSRSSRSRNLAASPCRDAEEFTKTNSQLGRSSRNNRNNTADNNNCNTLMSNGHIDSISYCSWMAFLQALWYGSMINSHINCQPIESLTMALLM
ncbi:hypothetical protein CapIbe_021392 [Capra ibex]